MTHDDLLDTTDNLHRHGEEVLVVTFDVRMK